MRSQTGRSSRGLLAGALVFFAAMSCLGARAEAGVLHVILAADTGAAGIGPSMEANLARLRMSILMNVPRAQLDLRVIPRGQFRSASIVRTIQTLPVGPEDSVFFYYCGHGAWDPTRGTYLLASGDGGLAGVFLAEIRRQISARQPRFAAVVLDCCNQLRPISGSSIGPTPAQPAPPDVISPAFDQLFFGAAGSQVVISSSAGEYAVVLPTIQTPAGPVHQGSLFSANLIGVLNEVQGDRPRWSPLVETVQARMDEQFRQVCRGGIIPLGSGPVRQARQTIDHRAY